MDFNDSRNIYIATTASSAVSFIVCSIIIYLYLSRPKLRNFSFKMICNLVFYDILHCVAFFIPSYETDKEDSLCKCQSLLINISSMLCNVWAFIIGLHLYLRTSGRDTEGFMKWYVISNWVVSLGLGMAPLIGGNYGNNFGWCWVKPESFIYEFILSFIPIWGAIIANCFFYVHILKKAKKAIGNIEENKNLLKFFNKLKYYPLVSLACYCPATINRVLVYFYDPNFYFVMFGGVASCCQGLLNCIVYGLNTRIKEFLIAEPDDTVLSSPYYHFSKETS
jgi:G protein-coupled glucose receptor regulating Gpa2